MLTFLPTPQDTDALMAVISDDADKPRFIFDEELECFIRFIPVLADLKVLSRKQDWEIREAVARHPQVTVELLTRLQADKEPEVVKAATLSLQRFQ